MRWPLRRQILLPMVGTLLLTIGVVSALNAWLASTRLQRQIERQLADVQRTLAAGNFPLESNVLRQMRGLTGAEYVVTNRRGGIVAASDAGFANLQSDSHARRTVSIDRRPVGGGEFLLHAFYPIDDLHQAQRQAVWPPLVIGALAIVLVAAAAFLVARHVTQPIRQLRSQVERIAQGDFQPVPEPTRDDEVRDLVAAVNRMARQLAQYEQQTRQSERLQTLGTLGGGIAHQIRNAATGCRIALDLHQRDCPLAAGYADGQEPLAVAVRQLELIETHIQRFLTLGRPTAEIKHVVNLVEVTKQALTLVQPMAKHVGVTIETSQAPSLAVLGDEASLVQMLVNLLVNAVEATSHASVLAGTGATEQNPQTVIVRTTRAARRCELAVGDPGPGPAPAIQSRLFQPFATDKAGGTGLGLVVARQIAEDHGGLIRWHREDERTWFVVELPRYGEGAMLNREGAT